KESFERTATSRYTYDPVAPGIEVMTYVKPAALIEQEWVWGGESHIVPFYYDIYRVEVALSRPEGYASNEPVSFYGVEVSKDDGATWQPITDMPYGAVSGGYNGASQTIDTYGAYYPGTYDFAAYQSFANEDSQFASNFSFLYFVDVTNKFNTTSMTDPEAEDPTTWLYRATAYYGSSDEVQIAEPAAVVTIPVSAKVGKRGDNESYGEQGLTGVSVVKTGMEGLVAYPNPADNVLNIKAGKALGNVEIFSVAGALVKKVNAGEQSSATLDVSDLAAGVYYLRAAGARVTVIKK
ncbi:MAG: T9SS type A sorting domain-containing protein, partial [Muribaculaceae bacterium]|nr:T9SS type A sorting domain-containing protein [Muribaculaceae bacterium]